mmetsp:Transcript_14040/g.29572  ORF Transcript_14040/g.29572 Transcript_14040/m.29572 type:complete len:80 (+) Transcript_14040:1240-1479(+)
MVRDADHAGRVRVSQATTTGVSILAEILAAMSLDFFHDQAAVMLKLIARVVACGRHGLLYYILVWFVWYFDTALLIETK